MASERQRLGVRRKSKEAHDASTNSSCTFPFGCFSMRQAFCRACLPPEDSPKEMLLDAEPVAMPSWMAEEKPTPISLAPGDPSRPFTMVSELDLQAPSVPSVEHVGSLKRPGSKKLTNVSFKLTEPEAEASFESDSQSPTPTIASVKPAAKKKAKDVVMDNENSIFIERTYDFYDAQRHKVTKKNVSNTTALHERRRASRIHCKDEMSSPTMREAMDADGSDDKEWEVSHVKETRRSMSKSSVRSGGSSGSEDQEEHDEPTLMRTLSTISRFDEDNVTNWAVIVGKFLNRRVLGFSSLAQEAVRQQRKSVFKGRQTTKVLPGVRNRALTVVQQAKALVSELAGEDDVFDWEWNADNLLVRLFHRDYIDTIMLLAKSAVKLIKEQPIVPEVSAPCRVFGDIHGQLRDLLLFFKAFGFPQKGRVNFIFNGDFVDRGRHQVEVMFLLLALKLAMPEQVHLVRGNHEDSAMNEKYGFRDEIMRAMGKAFGEKTFACIQQVFDVLPFAALVDNKVLCVHGGIGDGKWSLNDLRGIKRPISSDYIRQSKVLMNILWSDPIEEDEGGEQVESKERFGVHQSPRSSNMPIMDFGWNVTKTFCARNGLSLVIRSHQSKLEGHGFDVMHDRMLIRVFSARDYEGNGNDGAVLLLSPAEMQPPVSTPGGSRAPDRGLKARLQVVGRLIEQAGNKN